MSWGQDARAYREIGRPAMRICGPKNDERRMTWYAQIARSRRGGGGGGGNSAEAHTQKRNFQRRGNSATGYHVCVMKKATTRRLRQSTITIMRTELRDGGQTPRSRRWEGGVEKRMRLAGLGASQKTKKPFFICFGFFFFRAAPGREWLARRSFFAEVTKLWPQPRGCEEYGHVANTLIGYLRSVPRHGINLSTALPVPWLVLQR